MRQNPITLEDLARRIHRMGICRWRPMRDRSDLLPWQVLARPLRHLRHLYFIDREPTLLWQRILSHLLGHPRASICAAWRGPLESRRIHRNLRCIASVRHRAAAVDRRPARKVDVGDDGRRVQRANQTPCSRQLPAGSRAEFNAL